MVNAYLEQLQAWTDGCIGGDALLIIVSRALDWLVQQFHQGTETTNIIKFKPLLQ